MDPVTAPVTAIADFFVELFKEGLTPATIKGYRTSLTSVLSKLGRGDIISDKSLGDLITAMSIKKPKTARVLPTWDLGLILQVLKDTSYEALKNADLKHLTLKTVFLVAMASESRRNELQALMFVDTYCKIEQDGSRVTLYFAPGFARNYLNAAARKAAIGSANARRLAYSAQLYVTVRDHVYEVVHSTCIGFSRDFITLLFINLTVN